MIVYSHMTCSLVLLYLKTDDDSGNLYYWWFFDLTPNPNFTTKNDFINFNFLDFSPTDPRLKKLKKKLKFIY